MNVLKVASLPCVRIHRPASQGHWMTQASQMCPGALWESNQLRYFVLAAQASTLTIKPYLNTSQRLQLREFTYQNKRAHCHKKSVSSSLCKMFHSKSAHSHSKHNTISRFTNSSDSYAWNGMSNKGTPASSDSDSWQSLVMQWQCPEVTCCLSVSVSMQTQAVWPVQAAAVQLAQATHMQYATVQDALHMREREDVPRSHHPSLTNTPCLPPSSPPAPPSSPAWG